LENRGVTSDLALEVAAQMTDHDALGAHAREELGMFGLAGQANPALAAGASALAFAVGGGLPLLGAAFAPAGFTWGAIAGVAVLALALLGACSAKLGGTPVLPSLRRVIFWGLVAMLVTSGVGRMFETLAA